MNPRILGLRMNSKKMDDSLIHCVGQKWRSQCRNNNNAQNTHKVKKNRYMKVDRASRRISGAKMQMKPFSKAVQGGTD